MESRKNSWFLWTLTLILALLIVGCSEDKDDVQLPEPMRAEDFPQARPEVVEVGRLLFFDPRLSGNDNISCADCHHPNASTADNLSLPIGEGGSGIGELRDTGESAGTLVVERVPRNAPSIIGLGHKDVLVAFHDGRVEVADGMLITPAGSDFLLGVEPNALKAQAAFPVTSATEMAGQHGENEIADIADSANPDLQKIWALLAQRVAAIPEYVELFMAAYPDEVFGPEDITFTLIVDAIGSFEATFAPVNTEFDKYLRGEPNAMSDSSIAGMNLFFGKAGCSNCHSGTLLSDQEFHAIAVPAIGPGKGHGINGRDDLGRGAVTGNAADDYKFRTPMLRHVWRTGPYMHNGAIKSLRAAVEHHLDPVRSLNSYNCPDQLVLPSRPDLDALDCQAMSTPDTVAAIAAANELKPVALTTAEVDQLMTFLQMLTDLGLQDRIDSGDDIPDSVPSGLPVTR